MKLLPTMVLFGLFLFSGCEKYIGFQYEAPSLHRTARLSGTIVNTVTGEAVSDAHISFGFQETVTDRLGNYRMDYLLREDDQRDKPVPVIISAWNFETYTTEKIVFPQDTEFNFNLDYAAPIIERFYVGATDEEAFVQVEVRDYQGIGDIRSVIVKFYYEKMGEPEYRQVTVPADYVRMASNTSGFFRAATYPDLPDLWTIRGSKLEIHAEDYSGNVHDVDMRSTSRVSEDPLY
jgi:hypothetical protein